MRARLRRLLSIASIVLGVCAIAFGLAVGRFVRLLYDSELFAERAAVSLDDPRVAAFVAARVTDAVLKRSPDLTGFRPVIQAATQAAIRSDAFRRVARRAALRSHRLLLAPGTRDVLLAVGDVGVVVRSALATTPQLAEKIPRDTAAQLASIGQGPLLRRSLRFFAFAERLRRGVLATLAMGLALVVLGAALALDRRKALFLAGASLTALAAPIALVGRFGGGPLGLLAREPEARAALHGLWDAFAGPLGPRALVMGAIGLFLAAAATSALDRVQVKDAGRALARCLERPFGPGGRLARALGLVLAGGFTVFQPEAVLAVVAVVVGGAGIFVGVRELIQLALATVPHEVVPGGVEAPAALGGRGHWAWLAASTLGLATLAALGFVLWRWALVESVPRAAGSSDACNGHPELCERRLDQVVFAATHNAMGSEDAKAWMFPQQERGIPRQLEDGIRAFLLDVHFGVPVGEWVRTDLEDEPEARAKYEAAVGREGLEAAMRIRDRLTGGDESKRDLYLCHGFCELGATLLRDRLQDMRDFLVANPGEVLILIVEDPGPSAAQIEAAFRESGLLELVYTGPTGPPWPTLREMVALDQRVVVFSEYARPGAAWYRPAWGSFQETPYSFKAPEQMSCRPNRGGTAGSLFLLNNWIDTAPRHLPSNAEKVNAHDTLLDRARRCGRERGRTPNLIAVDFYRRGDVVGVARVLNGLGGGPADNATAPAAPR